MVAVSSGLAPRTISCPSPNGVRATPGNVGVFQLVYAVTAHTLGLSKDAAVGVALLLQTIQNVPVTVLGAILAPDLLLRRGADAAA